MNTRIDCKTVSRLLSDALERELEPDDGVRVELHMGVCAACRNVQQHMTLLRRAMKGIDERRPDLWRAAG